MQFTLEVEHEVDSRWLAEITSLREVMAYGQTRAEAIERVKALALRVLADRVDHGEPVSQTVLVTPPPTSSRWSDD